MKYRIRDVENFLVTAKCRTILEAAKLLGIGQPALSESIKRLEADTDRILFYRSRNGIQLTAQGRNFLRMAQKAILALKELEAPADDVQALGAYEISIGCHQTVASYSLPNALSFLKKTVPGFNVKLRHDLSRNIQAEIQAGKIDVGIVINPSEVPDLVIRPIAKDQVGIWSNRSSSKHDLIICDTNLVQTQAILKRWQKRSARVLSTNSFELICQLTARGIGYGIIPERAAQVSGLPITRLQNLPTFEDRIAIVHRPEFGKNKFEKQVIESLKQALK